MKQSWQILDEDLILDITRNGGSWLILEPHPDFEGQWIVESLEPSFFLEFNDLIGAYRAISVLGLTEFLERAEDLDYRVAFSEDPFTILDAYERLNDSPPFALNSTLPGTIQGFLPYQIQGFNFLKDLDSGVVLWSTGTGKTVLTSALIKYHLDMASFDTALFVVKAHNKVNTQRTLRRLTGIDSIVLDGPKKRREEVLARLKEAPSDPTVIITNYEKFRIDHKLLAPIFEGHRVLIVWDEMPTKLKNRTTQLYQSVRELLYRGQGVNWDLRRPKSLRQYMLSATPIENCPEDFYNTTRLLDPRIYGNVKQFYAEYVSKYSYFDQFKPEVWHNLEKMGLKASHITHQIDKADPDIASQFPSVLKEEFYIDWNEAHQKVYDRLAKAAKTKMESRDEFEDSVVLALISVMQMLCDMPSMINNSAALRESYEEALESIADGVGSIPQRMGSEAALELLRTVGKPLSDEGHTKIETLKDLVTEQHPNEKIVIFSAFNRALLPSLSTLLDEWGVKHVVYSGTAKQKQEAQDSFTEDPEVRVFLSSDAGSDSINLEQGSVVIHYDLPWKFSTMIQRENRIHRVTSGFENVRYYTLLMANSVEERKLDIIRLKYKYHEAIFKGAVADQSVSARLTREDLAWILSG